MYDQHVHSNYSIDSNEPMENYIKKTEDKVITFTEHYDFNDPFNEGVTVRYDIKGQREEMNLLENKYNVRLLQGIELGHSSNCIEEMKQLLEDNSFDVVLLSIHHNDRYDYMMNVTDIPQIEIAKDYFNHVEEALQVGYDADVLTHLDFGLRMRSLTLKEIMSFEEQLVRILKLVINNNMSLEINSKGITVYKTEEIYNYFIDLYTRLGGVNFVVNSDAHEVAHYKSNFQYIINMLVEKGIENIDYFIKRERHQIKIK